MERINPMIYRGFSISDDHFTIFGPILQELTNSNAILFESLTRLSDVQLGHISPVLRDLVQEHMTVLRKLNEIIEHHDYVYSTISSHELQMAVRVSLITIGSLIGIIVAFNTGHGIEYIPDLLTNIT